ncbi:MAG: serine hydrolase domain-containing protein [Dehalococcoidia bacterium]
MQRIGRRRVLAAGLAGMSLMLPAVRSTRAIAAAQPGGAPSCGAPTVTPSSATLLHNPRVAAAIASLPGEIEVLRLKVGIPSVALGIVHDQQVLFEAGFGCANVAAGIPATPRTVYRIGSITKVFQATMLMQLRDTGRLELSDPVERYVPEVFYRAPDGSRASPTFLQLASHTAGLPQAMPRGLSTVPQFLRYVEGITAEAAPGTRYAYSNVGFVLLGQACAMIAGEPYHALVDHHIFAPLGMTSCTYDISTVDRSRLAVGYTHLEQTTTGRQGRAAGYGNPFPPSGTILSTVEDMERFIMLQFRRGPAGGDQILAGGSIEEMWRPVAPTQGRASIAIGWHTAPFGSQTLVSKNGGQAGFTSLLCMLPELKLGVIGFVNMSPEAGPGAGSWLAELERMILTRLAGALDHPR